MTRKKFRAPAEKKALSYAKDRRNTYGENDKASRKLIPLRKAQENRQDRRKTAQEVAKLDRLDELTADVLESSIRHDIHRVGGWRKGRDEPLGNIVAWAKETRASRAERSKREPEPEDPDALRMLAKRYRRIARWVARRWKIGRKANAQSDFEATGLRLAQACEDRADEIIRERTESS